ncbi:MAG: hypothetical protein ACW98J_07595, partial [Candidatus Thorarchaeota archaeon]
MDSETRLIRCHAGRCKKCPEKIDLGCRKLTQVGKFSGDNIQTVLIEVERGFLHFCRHKELQQMYPPWYGDGWETVFVGIDCPLFEELDDILEIYKVGPYLTLFKKSRYHIQYHSIPIVRTSLEYSLVEEL